LHQEREEIWKGRELMERKKRLREEIKEGREEKIRKEENKGKGKKGERGNILFIFKNCD
jgi:hypothetical protein